ncbi:hypothetical protein UY3_04208 [Chelonia mydas]|uniref:Zinc finger and SCAN domain-containing protein 29 n=1 Tax=Chelonia mydas TaxID=8469 RepID=M7BMU6_CHEMY|nr:hypothetical protein UY3_04208 [Chelonia mydas]
MKIKELRQAYQKTKEANGHSRSEPQTCHFYDELRAILGSAPTMTPPLSVDTCKGGVSRNRDEDFGDEEDNDEEDSANQASRETILPNCQELFIAPEPIPSQGRVLDHEAGEGTSGSIFTEMPQLYRCHCTFLSVDKPLELSRLMGPCLCTLLEVVLPYRQEDLTNLGDHKAIKRSKEGMAQNSSEVVQ